MKRIPRFWIAVAVLLGFIAASMLHGLAWVPMQKRRQLAKLYAGKANLSAYRDILGAPTCEFSGDATNECVGAWKVFGGSMVPTNTMRYSFWSEEGLPYYWVLVGASTNKPFAEILAIHVNQESKIFQ